MTRTREAGVVPWPSARHYDGNLLLALAYTGFSLNLFNMIRQSPFDGGRIAAVRSPRIGLAGVPVLHAARCRNSTRRMSFTITR